MIRPASHQFVRALTFGVMALALALSACGRKGPLDPPPGAYAEPPPAAPAAPPSVMGGVSPFGQPAGPTGPTQYYNADGKPIAPPGPKRRILIDPLLD